MQKTTKTKRKSGLVAVLLILGLGLCTGCTGKQTVYLTSETDETECADLLYMEENGTVPQDTIDTEDAVIAEETTDAGGENVCYVYVCGAVAVPGVYSLPSGSRIYQAIEAAGGIVENAAPESLNQAEQIEDGQMIQVLTKEEVQNGQVQTGSEMQGNENAGDGRVNLNTATEAQLMTLPGIGEAKAESIISYREEHGNFSSVEDIMKIEGIKEGVYSKIKDSITVN